MQSKADSGEHRMEIEFDEARLHATLIIRSIKNLSELPSETDLFNFINEKKIGFGLDVTAVKKLALAISENPGIEHRELIATGHPPELPVHESIEFFVEEPPPVVIDESTGQADYRKVMRYLIVENGTLLARKIHARKGTEGIDVYGNIIDVPLPKKEDLATGENVNVIEKEDYTEYRSSVKGIFYKRIHQISVSPVLKIDGDAGMETGNIEYDGDVSIQGNIEFGTEVHVGGNLIVGGRIESGHIFVQGNLIVRNGINTRQEGNIRVGGKLEAHYIENSNLTTLGDVIVQSSIITSNVVCCSHVILGRSSKIAGGQIYVYGSLIADVIGNPAGVKTIIQLGVHPLKYKSHKAKAEELKRKEEELGALSSTLKFAHDDIKRYRGNPPEEKKKKLSELLEKYKKNQSIVHKLKEQTALLLKEIYYPDEITLSAAKMVYPGTEIHLRRFTEVIKAPQSVCTWRYKSGMNAPSIEAFKESREK